jgi:hypothetical protein
VVDGKNFIWERRSSIAIEYGTHTNKEHNNIKDH